MGEQSASIRTLPALLSSTAIAAPRLDELRTQLVSAGVTCGSLAAQLKLGRPVLLGFLKEIGVDKLGDRQQIANAAAKAERLNMLRPYLSEENAIASGLANGKCVPFPHAEKAASWLANATRLKELGNEAFKRSKNEAAIDLYGDAALAATRARSAPDASSSSGGGGGAASTVEAVATTLLVSLHANTSAAFLKLERWVDVVDAATCALDLDESHAKALYRRGVAHRELKRRAEAKRDLVECVKLDPQNREAREALSALDAAKRAAKQAYQAAFVETLARDEAEDAEESEDTVLEAWRKECDRLRLEKGRCVVEVGDQPWEIDDPEDHQSQPRFGGFQLAPITLEDFKRERKAKRQAAEAEAAAEAAAAKERYVQAAREAARRDGADLGAIDRLAESLRAEGVDTSDPAAMGAALRARGIDPDDREQFIDFARDYSAANPVYGGVSWGGAASAASPDQQTPVDLVPETEDDEVEAISTDGMTSAVSWKQRWADF